MFAAELSGVAKGGHGRAFAQPSQFLTQPSQTFAQPSQTFAQPSQTFAQPSQTFAQPSQTFAQPSQTFAQPSQVALDSREDSQQHTKPPYFDTVKCKHVPHLLNHDFRRDRDRWYIT